MPSVEQKNHQPRVVFAREDQTGSNLQKSSEAEMPIEAASALLDTVPWELLESSHAGRARKQLLQVMQQINPDLEPHEAAIKALQYELDYKVDQLITLKEKKKTGLQVTALEDDIDFLKTLLQE